MQLLVIHEHRHARNSSHTSVANRTLSVVASESMGSISPPTNTVVPNSLSAKYSRSTSPLYMSQLQVQLVTRLGPFPRPKLMPANLNAKFRARTSIQEQQPHYTLQMPVLNSEACGRWCAQVYGRFNVQ